MRACLVLLLLVTACAGSSEPPQGSSTTDPRFVASVVDFQPGTHAGFGQDRMPQVVLGPPQGGGRNQGGLDVVSLGTGGTITVEFGVDAVDGPGADFIVFENAFVAGNTTVVFAEPGQVEVSADGSAWAAFPCEPGSAPYAGCAGTRPVLASDANPVDITDPTVAGGDAFDLADVGMDRARFLRITDRSNPALADTAGFDLDAAVVIHAAP